MFAVKVKNELVEQVRKLLTQKRLVDNTRKFIKVGKFVEIPVRSGNIQDYNFIKGYDVVLARQKKIVRFVPKNPFENILQLVNIPDRLKKELPKKWEKLGDVLLLKMPPALENFENEVAEVYGKVLHAKTVVKYLGIHGVKREASVKKLFGESTETVHKENKIKFKLDVAKIMLSSGNLEERKRMASISNSNEIVVDMFAGIGYFSIPLAFYSKPKKILAYEINPIAYKYLCNNIELNKVQNIVEPWLEDCLKAKECLADRVIMGYLKDTSLYLPKALRILKSQGGIIHYHENCPNELLPEEFCDKVKSVVEREKKRVKILKFIKVKSYAPGVTHVALDLEIK